LSYPILNHDIIFLKRQNTVMKFPVI